MTQDRDANVKKKPAMQRFEGRAFQAQEKGRYKAGNGCGVFQTESSPVWLTWVREGESGLGVSG